MESFEEVDCAICNTNEIDRISSEGQHGLPANVVLCKNCGLGYLNPRWDEKTYLNFYKNEYDGYYRPSLEEEIDVTKFESNPIINRLEKNQLIPKNPINILDIGSGAGENILHFQQKFKNSSFFAIEPSIKSQKFLESKGIEVISDDANSDWEIKSNTKYSIIILRHVLEHFLEPKNVLDKIRNSLTDDGIVYFAVPNNLNPRGHLIKKWFRVVHTYYFNKYTLKNILSLSNLKVLLMVEGDRYNRHELYAIAAKADKKVELEIRNEDYETQLNVFRKELKKENSLLGKTKYKMKKILNID